MLNQLAAWWFDQTGDVIANHKIVVPDPNATIVTTVQPFTVEVIVRGYITGVTSTALWYRYSIGERDIYGYQFPEGLHKNEQLPTPIITPTTKGGPPGHDERLTCVEVVERGYLDRETWDQVQASALAIFKRGQEIAAGVADLTSEQQLWFRKGELTQMLWLQNHQAAHEAAYAALLAEQEGDEGVGTVAEGRAHVIE